MQRLKKVLGFHAGSSMIETMVVGAGILGMATVAVNMMNEQNKTQKTLEVKSEQTAILEQIKSTLGDEANCRETFQNLTTSSTVPSLKTITAGVVEEIFRVNVPTPSGIKIRDYTLDPSRDDLGPNQVALQISISRGKMVRPDVVQKFLKLNVELNASSQIQNCHAVSDSDTFWVRSFTNSNAIYFNLGSVGSGIATVPNGPALTVSGPLRVAEVALCDATKIGAISYNFTLKQILLCKAGGWSPVSPPSTGPWPAYCRSSSPVNNSVPIVGSHGMCGISKMGVSNMGLDDHWRGGCNIRQAGPDWFIDIVCKEAEVYCEATCL